MLKESEYSRCQVDFTINSRKNYILHHTNITYLSRYRKIQFSRFVVKKYWHLSLHSLHNDVKARSKSVSFVKETPYGFKRQMIENAIWWKENFTAVETYIWYFLVYFRVFYLCVNEKNCCPNQTVLRYFKNNSVQHTNISGVKG